MNEILSGFGWAANPADITGVASRDEFADVLTLLEREPHAGALLIATAGTPSQAQIVINLKSKTPKPVIFLSTGGDNTEDGLAKLREANVPVFTSPSRAAKSLADLFRCHQRRQKFLDSETVSSPHHCQTSAVPPLRPNHAYGARRQEAAVQLGHPICQRGTSP